MKTILILFIFFVSTIQLKAQQNDADTSFRIKTSPKKLSVNEYFRLTIIKSMINSIDFEKLNNSPQGFAQLVSVNIVFNEYGKVDTSIVRFKRNNHFELKKNLTTELKAFRPISEYANHTIVLPIMYIRMNENVINLEHNFLEGFIDLFSPHLLNNKKVILLKPEINPFSQIR